MKPIFRCFLLPALLFVLAVALVRLLTPAVIVVDWETGSEVNTAGFLLYRSASAEGPFDLLSETPIPSQGDGLTGAAYRYEDRQVVWGARYFYQLEEIERDGGRNRYPQVVEARAGAGWPWALAAGAFVVALWGAGSWILNRRPPSSD